MVDNTIKIGVLFSQSGPMAVTETAHIQGVLLACEELNAQGGVCGRLIEPVIVNPDGSDQRYDRMATELLLKQGINAIFGCCLSTSRKAVLPIVERYNGILFYPSVYEGFEFSPNVIYGGAVPNQVIVPLLEYLFAHYGKRIALFGSDTLYAREINRIVNEFLSDSGGSVVEEIYFPFGTPAARFEPALKRVVASGVDAIMSTVVGEDSVMLYEAFHSVERGGRDVPIASLTTTESELGKMSPDARAGHLSALPYFGTLDNSQNKAFVAAFQKRYGDQKTPGVYTEVCYTLVHIYADAVRQCGETDSDSILPILTSAVFKGPSGDMSIDLDTNHFMRRPLIGRANAAGEFDIVWRSNAPIRADPYLVAYGRSLNGR
jgi:branched-chain amino acid transport system substrate-binding protein